MKVLIGCQMRLRTNKLPARKKLPSSKTFSCFSGDLKDFEFVFFRRSLCILVYWRNTALQTVQILTNQFQVTVDFAPFLFSVDFQVNRKKENVFDEGNFFLAGSLFVLKSI